MIVSLQNMRVLLLILFLSFSTLIIAQSSLSVKIVQASPFVVYFNADSTSSELGEPVVLDSIPSGLHNIDILVIDSITTLLSSRVILYDGIGTTLLIDNSSDSIQLLLPNTKLNSENSAANQISASRTLQTRVLEVSYSSCPVPMNRTDFNAIITEAKSKNFQKDRLKTLNKIIGVNCVTSEQLNQALNLIDDEEKKLALIIRAEDKIFDIRNVQRFSSQFILSRYQDQFNSWLIMVKNQG